MFPVIFFILAAFFLGVFESLRVRAVSRKNSSPAALFAYGVGRIGGYAAVGAAFGQLGLWIVEAAFTLSFGRRVLLVPGVVLAALAVLVIGWRLCGPPVRAAFRRTFPALTARVAARREASARPLARLAAGAAAAFRPTGFSVAALVTMAFTTLSPNQGAVGMACFGLGMLPALTAQSLFPGGVGERWKMAATGGGAFGVLFLSSIFIGGAFGYDVLAARYIGDDAEHIGHAQSADESTVAVNEPLPDIEMTDINGKKHRLSDYRGAAVALVAVGTHCPCVESYRQRLNDLAREYAPRGVTFLGFNPNADEPLDEIKRHQAEKPFVFPILVDSQQKMADSLSALCMTEVFLADAHGVLRYHGRIDDNTYHPDRVRDTILRDALEQIVSGRPVAKACRPAIGCAIVRKRAAERNAAE